MMRKQSQGQKKQPASATTEPMAWEVLDSCPDAVEVFEPDGSIVYMNEAAASQHAALAHELVGTSIWDLYAPGQAVHRKTLANRAVSLGLPVQFTDRLGDGWGEVLLRPICGQDGKINHIVTYSRDITRQISAEERLKLVTLHLITAQEEERRRVARDLHDDIGQSMIALILSLKTIHSGILSGRGGTGDQLKQTIHTVENMMKHIRSVFYELRSPSFSALPLAKVLESLCASDALSTGLRIDFSSQRDFPLIPDVQATALYRFVQEGINNVVKHAKAKSVWINLDYLEGEVGISLEDDGQGFDLSDESGYGMGLQGIRERFLMLDGSFDIESASGKGTRLYGSLPFMTGPSTSGTLSHPAIYDTFEPPARKQNYPIDG